MDYDFNETCDTKHYNSLWITNQTNLQIQLKSAYQDKCSKYARVKCSIFVCFMYLKIIVLKKQ